MHVCWAVCEIKVIGGYLFEISCYPKDKTIPKEPSSSDETMERNQCSDGQESKGGASGVFELSWIMYCILRSWIPSTICESDYEAGWGVAPQ